MLKGIKMCAAESGFYTNRQNLRLFYEKWMPDRNEPKGIVQIAHGMRESTDYYREFCEALAEAGYGAFIHDARGHGRTAGIPGEKDFQKNAGDIGENGFENMADDLAEINGALHKRYPGVPVFLLGHSMGSVLARLYISRYGKTLHGVIFSGTAGLADPDRLKKWLETAEEEYDRLGKEAAAVRPAKLLSEFFNERFQPVKSGHEYMTRDESMIQEAVGSPYYALPYRTGFFVSIFRAMQKIDTAEAIERIPKSLPILSVSGDMDAFGDYGDGVKRLFQQYRQYGIKKVTDILYPGGRHEMLRETNRREVFQDIIQWLNTVDQ